MVLAHGQSTEARFEARCRYSYALTPETDTRTRLDTAGRNNAILKMFYGTSPATYFEHVIGSDMRLH